MTGGPWRGESPDADDLHRYTPVTRLHVGDSEASEGLSLAVESYGARHGIELLERMGAACVVWLRRSGRAVLARQVGAVAGEPHLESLFDRPLAEILADVRRLGGAVAVPGRLPDGTPWTVRFVPLPEGAVAALWMEAAAAEPEEDSPTMQAEAAFDPATPRRLMAIAGKVGALGDGAGRVRERAMVLQRALDREAWRILGQRGIGLPMDPRTVPLTAKLEAIQPRVASLVPADVQVQWDIPPGLARVEVPGPAVRYIVEELVRNAVASFDGGAGRLRIRGGVLELQESVSWHGLRLDRGTFVFVEVTDNGVGIEDDLVDALATGRVTGSLQAVHGLALGWHGGMRIRSSPGRGTIVQVAFPAIGVERPTQRIVPVPESRRCALVVMAPGAGRSQLVEGLEDTGLEVVMARDSTKAVERFKEQSARGGIVLLAVQHVLPDGSGLDLARRLREMAPILAVVLMTDEPVDEVEDEFPDLTPGRVVPLQYAGRMGVGAANLLLPRVRTRGS